MSLVSAAMNGSLEDVRALCAVVDLGTISAAAAQLRETKGAVSRRISRLERRLGATLLARTPRSVTPTEEGMAFYEKARDALTLLDEAAEAARRSRSLPRGLLRVTVPFDLGLDVFPDLIVQFCARHPQVMVELVLSDALLDLSAQRIDLAMRATSGALPDTVYRASRLVDFQLALFAAPQYLNGRPPLTGPEALEQHDFVAFRESSAGGARIRLQRSPSHSAEVALRPRIFASDYAGVHRLLVAGAGIGVMPALVAARWVAEGRLARILPEWNAGCATLYALTVAGRQAPARVAVFRDFVRTSLEGG